MLRNLRARMAVVPKLAGQPLPATVPGGWEPRRDDNAPGAFYDDLNRELADPETRAAFEANRERIQAVDEAEGLRAEVADLQKRLADAERARGAAVAAHMLCRSSGPSLQRLLEVESDRDALDRANGRLVEHVRVLEAQLRGCGIEPEARRE